MSVNYICTLTNGPKEPEKRFTNSQQAREYERHIWKFAPNSGRAKDADDLLVVCKLAQSKYAKSDPLYALIHKGSGYAVAFGEYRAVLAAKRHYYDLGLQPSNTPGVFIC